MPEPATEPLPTSAVESDLAPETIAARLEKLPFGALRAILAESERLARNTWTERPDGFVNIRGGKIKVNESSQTHKFKLDVAGQGTFSHRVISEVTSLSLTEYDSVADAKAVVREILEKDRARIIE